MLKCCTSQLLISDFYTKQGEQNANGGHDIVTIIYKLIIINRYFVLQNIENQTVVLTLKRH